MDFRGNSFGECAHLVVRFEHWINSIVFEDGYDSEVAQVLRESVLDMKSGVEYRDPMDLSPVVLASVTHWDHNVRLCWVAVKGDSGWLCKVLPVDVDNDDSARDAAAHGMVVSKPMALVVFPELSYVYLKEEDCCNQ